MKHGRLVSVIGLGYVGLPVAVAFSGERQSVVAFDINNGRIDELRAGYDNTGEIESSRLRGANLFLTNDPDDLKNADFHIITVPTPIDAAKRPDLGPLLAATKMIGARLGKGDVVVYESTVYPGATEEECVPVLEAESGLVCGRDFGVGYSPERINPGDPEHRFETITKVVSGFDDATLKIVADVYGSVIKAGIHLAPDIKTAEAAKVIENTQRDLNIALMNELSMVFHHLGIDTHDVLAAAGTKWNFLPFVPGLVGGHCIGVDPYYLTHRAERAGYKPRVILSGRKINDDMGTFIADETVRRMVQNDQGVENKNTSLVVTVLGVTFKENVPDCRNSKVIDIIRRLEVQGVMVQVHDPIADAGVVRQTYGVELSGLDDLQPADAIVLAISHSDYLDQGWDLIVRLLRDGHGTVSDVRGSLARDKKPYGIDLWRL